MQDETDKVEQETRFHGILEKYNLAVKSANFGIWEFNYLTEEFYWDEVMEKFFACKLTTIQQFRDVWLTLVRPGDRPQLVSSFTQCLKTGTDFHAVFGAVVNNSLRYIETFATFKYNNATRRSEKVTGIAIDITEKKLAEIALKESEQLYRMLADNIDDIVTLHQLDGTVDYISPSSLRVLGNTLEDTQAKGGITFVHPDDIATVLQANKMVLDGAEYSAPYECRIQNAEGNWVVFENRNRAVHGDNGNIIGILTISRDITARKAAEEYYRLLAENITDIVALLTVDGKFEYISPSVERLLGYKQQDIVGTSPFDIIHPDDIVPLAQRTLDKNLNGEEGSYSGYRVKHKNGHWVYFDVQSKPVYNSEGRITHILKSSRDVSARVLAEQAKTESEQQYKLLADNIVDLVVLLTPGFKRVYVSPSSLALTGYTPDEMLATTPAQIIHPADIEYFYSHIENTLFKGEEKTTLAYYIRHKNGHLLFVQSIVKAIRDSNGEITNLLSNTRDITNQHNTEIAQRQSDEHYRMLADNIVDLIILLTPDFKRVYASPSCLALTGYTPEEFMGTTLEDIIYEEDLPAFSDGLNRTIFSGEDQVVLTTRIKHKTGQLVFVESIVKAIRNEKGELLRILSTIRDISRQHAAETALRTSEELYRRLANNIADFVILVTPDFKRLYASPSSFALTGYTPEEFLFTRLEDIVLDEDLPFFRARVNETLFKGDEQLQIATRIRHKNGHVIYVEAVLKAIRNTAGEVVNILSTIRNITRQHEAETALRASEELYRMLADNMFDMLILFGPTLQKLYVSPSSLQLTGYTPEEVMALPTGALVYPDDLNMFTGIVLDNANRGNDRFVLQYRGLLKDGSYKYLSSVFSIVRDAEGGLRNIIVTSRDIHAEKTAQRALTSSEEKYRMLADNMFDMLVLMDAQLNKLYISPSSVRLTGYTPDEMMILARSDAGNGNISKVDATIMENVQAGIDNFSINFSGRHKSGKSIHVSSVITVIRDDNQEVKNILATSRDITAEVEAQIALTNSEERYRSLVEASENIILVMDENGQYLFANALACEYVGTPIEEVLGKTIYDFFEPVTANHYVQKVRMVLKTGQGSSFEYALTAANNRVYLRNTLRPIFDANGNAYAVMLSLVDLTEMKNNADKLGKQNDELKQIAYLQSHIVRAPLANIEGIVNLFDESAMSPENAALLQLLKKSAVQLDNVVNEIVQRAIEVKHQTEA